MSAPILVIGQTGQLARAVARLEPDAITLSRQQLDLEQPDLAERLDAVLTEYTVRGVINAAAYTQVDQAETDRERAHTTNATAPKTIAQGCHARSIPLVHVSTDYVFDGMATQPYQETDPTKPVNSYGRSKHMGERAVLGATDRAAILRTSWVYDLEGRNFATTMLRLAEERDTINVVADQIGRPTHADVLARASLSALGHHGLYHVSGTGDPVSWAGFAEAIFHEAGKQVRVVPIPTSDFPTPARRPAYSVLDTQKFESEFGALPDWRDSLRQAFSRRG